MAKRKRRPGAGRPPLGPVAKKATLTARLEPSTRRALALAAAIHRPKLPVSRMAEILLKAGLEKPLGADRNRALARAVSVLSQNIERGTEQNWREDPFTAVALGAGLRLLIAYFGPRLPKQGDRTPVPQAVERLATKLAQESADRFRSPHVFGETLALNLAEAIRDALPSEINEWTVPVHPDLFGDTRENLALIARDLGIADGKKGKAKK